MKTRTLLPVVLIVLAGACNAGGGEAMADAPAMEARTSLELANLRRTLTIAHDKFNQLADAMPEETYAWRPMDGVRSVGDVYKHIAADNYFVPALMGVAAPEGTGVTSDGATFRAFQEREMTREEILEHVDASFAHMLSTMAATEGELGRAMMLGNSETTVGDVWIRAVVHLHEHLGQSIAYARANEVVPPWSLPTGQ